MATSLTTVTVLFGINLKFTLSTFVRPNPSVPARNSTGAGEGYEQSEETKSILM